MVLSLASNAELVGGKQDFTTNNYPNVNKLRLWNELLRLWNKLLRLWNNL